MEKILTIFILCDLILADILPLPCYTEPDTQINPVNCTARRYLNCSDIDLSVHHPSLYNQLYWPARPHDLYLKPIQDEWQRTNIFLPGFTPGIKPPRSGQIHEVKGFQIDFMETLTKVRKCIVVTLNNHTLDHTHRENNLTIFIKVWPMKGNTEYVFRSWSLPKPKENEIDAYQERTGKTGIAQWNLTDSTSDWLTTISFYNNTKEGYIRIWFVEAPVEYGFVQYEVTLRTIVSGEGTDQEDGPVTAPVKLTKTTYTFLDVPPGRYRVLVQPYDDKWNTLEDCKCKSKIGCMSCAVTTTSVIVVPDDKQRSSTTDIYSTLNEMTTKAPVTSLDDQHILPSVLGSLTLLVIIIIIIGCYKLRLDGSCSDIELCCFKADKRTRKESYQNSENESSPSTVSTSDQPNQGYQPDSIEQYDPGNISMISAETIEREFYPPETDDVICDRSSVQLQYEIAKMNGMCDCDKMNYDFHEYLENGHADHPNTEYIQDENHFRLQSTDLIFPYSQYQRRENWKSSDGISV